MRTARKAKMKKAALEREKAAATARTALNDAARALRDLTGALTEATRAAGLDERASELATKVRDSDALAKLAASSQQVATRTREAIHDAGLDARASEVAAKIREAETTKQARARATKASDEALARLGSKLSQGKAAERLGVAPRKRQFPWWIAALLGVAVGFVASKLASSQAGSEVADDFELAAQRLTQDTRDVSAPAAQPLLEDKVRTTLGQDPRTSDLERLNINVAEGTVFVRGSIPEGYDEAAIRDVIAGIEGVTDVDLQVTSKA